METECFRIGGMRTGGWICLLLCIVAAARAQSQGCVHLAEVPATAHVYVNAKPVAAKNGLLSLAPGWYQIQVERQEKDGLQAYRRFVQVLADRTVEMPIVWHPVLLALLPSGMAAYSPPGGDGPAGAPGPPARPYKPLPQNADTAMLRAPLQEARDVLLADFAAQVQDTLNSLSSLEKPIYLYIPGPPEPEPPGPQGNIGPQGAAGIPAEVGLIQAPTGVAFRTAMEQQLGLPALQQRLTALQARLRRLSEKSPFTLSSTPPSLQVLTPQWKADLDQAWKQRKALSPQGLHGELFGIIGKEGAPGPRGADGVAPAGAIPIRVSEEQEKQLLEMLTTDAATRIKIGALRQQLADLTTRVYLAEGLYREQFPPVLLQANRGN